MKLSLLRGLASYHGLAFKASLVAQSSKNGQNDELDIGHDTLNVCH
jgi:hypothetical protein